MKCNNCGKINNLNSKFCVECGTMLSTPPKKQNSTRKKTYSQWKPILKKVFSILLILIVINQFLGKKDMNYTRNSGGKLPIIVDSIAIEENVFMDMYIGISNLKETEYETAKFAIMAWDSDGFPLKLSNPLVYTEDSYIQYINFSNIASYESGERICSFDYADISYISIFLASYTDFDGKTWKNPVLKHVQKNAGKKFKSTDVFYFEKEEAQIYIGDHPYAWHFYEVLPGQM